MVPGTVKLLHHKKKVNINGDQEGCRLDLNRLLMRVDDSAGKVTSGIDKFGSVIDRMNMKFRRKFLNSLRSRPSTFQGSSV